MRNLEFLITALADVGDEADSRGLYSEADEITDILELLTKTAEITVRAYIKRKKRKGKIVYEVKSPKNKKWSGGTYSTYEAAKERLKEVEMFKHMKK